MFKLVGVDVYLKSDTTPDLPREIGSFRLILISNRGTKVWPPPAPDMNLIDWPRSRYESDSDVSDADINTLLQTLSEAGFHWTKAQKLYTKDGERQYSQPY